MTVWVNIEGFGTVEAHLLERYIDGDVRVQYCGKVFICKEEP